MMKLVMKMKASEMKQRQSGTIQAIQLSETDKKRLFYLGIYEGGTLTFLRRSPCKDPILFFAQGNQIILRARDASLIDVEVTE